MNLLAPDLIELRLLRDELEKRAREEGLFGTKGESAKQAGRWLVIIERIIKETERELETEPCGHCHGAGFYTAHDHNDNLDRFECVVCHGTGTVPKRA